MKIQFVCTGNTFRSRMAEAYLKSKNIPDLTVSSSGIKAKENLNGLVCVYTMRVLKKFKLHKFLSKKWKQTTKKSIENQDLVIFMEKTHYKFCKDKLHCSIKDYKIWNIADISDKLLEKNHENSKEIIVLSEKKFKKIKKNIDILFSNKI